MATRSARWGAPAAFLLGRVTYGHDPDAIRRLKAEVDGGIFTSGSGTLVRALLSDGLVHVLYLFV